MKASMAWWCRTLSAGVVAALLAACGGARPPVSAPGAIPQTLSSGTHAVYSLGALLANSHSGSELRKSHGPFLYVVNFDPAYNDVTIYEAKAKHPKPIGAISEGLFEPEGDCIDSQGTLYVTNIPGSSDGWISVYAAGQTKPSRVIKDGINIPIFCAIDAHGNLWVTNLGGRNVAEFKPDSSEPSTVITNGVPNPAGIAIDHSGKIYVSNDSGGSNPVSNVVVFAPGEKAPRRTITDGVLSPAGIAVDSTGTLYVTNVLQNNVEKYHTGKNHPYQTLTDAMSLPVAVTIGKNGWLYVTESGSPAPTIVEFPRNSSVPSTKKVTKGLEGPDGSAYFPPLLP